MAIPLHLVRHDALNQVDLEVLSHFGPGLCELLIGVSRTDELGGDLTAHMSGLHQVRILVTEWCLSSRRGSHSERVSHDSHKACSVSELDEKDSDCVPPTVNVNSKVNLHYVAVLQGLLRASL